MTQDALDIDALAQEIRRVDGKHDLGAGQLAEALAPFIRSISALRDGEATEGASSGWTYSINYGPDGEENWANLITPKGEHVANIRTHHAIAIVAGMNAPSATPPVAQTGTVGSEPVAWRGVVDGRTAFLCRSRDEIDRLASDYNATIEPLFAQTGTVGIRCGTCGEQIRPDPLTGTTCACARPAISDTMVMAGAAKFMAHQHGVDLLGYPNGTYRSGLMDSFRVALEAALSAPTVEGEGKHPDDAAVDRFADAMKAKLAKKRAEGRGGWDGPDCSAKILSDLLRAHVDKGDPLDVGNLAMMLHQRGERII